MNVGEQSAARQHRDAVRGGNLARRVFQAEVPHLRGGRSDEDNSVCRARFRESSVLAEKAIAGMNRLGAGLSRSFQ